MTLSPEAHVLLKCGCSNIAHHAQPHDDLPENHPSCPVHDCCEITTTPDLTGRVAICTQCHKREQPSSLALAFFNYRGPGSREALTICQCGYAYVAHTAEGRARNVPSNRRTVVEDGRCKTGFVLRGPNATDTYYCGCRGWD